MSLSIAFSPCPNDTYLFHAWAKGVVGCPISCVVADVGELNRWAREGKYALTKVSMYCLGDILQDYVLLPVGCALGAANGPKIVARVPYSLESQKRVKIAIPGRGTTAELLLDLLIDAKIEKYYCRYDEVEHAVQTQVVDCGVIIHETRFKYRQKGLVEVVDLGELWESLYQLPLPLGGIAAKRELGREELTRLTDTLRASLEHALHFPKASKEYILMHSTEKSADIIQKHIELFVNSETLQLSKKGEQSIEKLFSLARERGLIDVCNRSPFI